MSKIELIAKKLDEFSELLPLVVKPEVNVFNPERHTEFASTFADIQTLSDSVWLCTGFEGTQVAFGHNLCDSDPSNRKFFSLPDYHDITDDLIEAVKAEMEKDEQYAKSHRDELEKRKAYCSLFKEHLLSSFSHKQAVKTMNLFTESKVASFNDIYSVIAESYPHSAIVCFAGDDVCELTLSGDEMVITTYEYE